jgi:ABC-2 type transport system ATP-binding protein
VTASPEVATPPATVEVEHASKWFGNVVAVNDISFELRAGVTGLLGPNGAGKSTLLNMIAGFLRPSAGVVRVGGEASWQHPSIYRQVGLVMERESVYGYLSGYDFVLLNARLHGVADPTAATRHAIDLVEMTEAQARRTGEYSKGMRQRIKIAASIVHDPAILLLDEPFSGADPRQRLHMTELLRQMAADGRTILFSSHILEEMERLGEDVLVIVGGRLAASGDFRAIRRLMTDRPHAFSIRASDVRGLAGALLAEESVHAVEIDGDHLIARTLAFGPFTSALPRIARASSISIYEVAPLDESLESVFSYLVAR